MSTRLTPEAMDRSYEMSASLQERHQLPEWMYSPPTPERAEQIETGPDGKPPSDHSSVVNCGGALYDRIVLYRIHHYSPPAVFDRVGPVLSAFFHNAWNPYEHGNRVATDSRPENRSERLELLSLAEKGAAAGTSTAIERRRVWRIIDWQIRTESAALLELAGWGTHATAFRALAPVVGPSLPEGAGTIIRKVWRETDRASSAALSGVRPYSRRLDRPGPGRCASEGLHFAHGLYLAALNGRPDIYGRHVRKDCFPQRNNTDLGRAVQAGSFARLAADHDPRISDRKIREVVRALEASARALLEELIEIGAERRDAAA